MLYALRKLIAFVFLGGIFWLTFRDPEKLWEPSYLDFIGVLTLLFGIFWLLVPELVVFMRIRKRVAQNRERYWQWREKNCGKIKPFRLRRDINLKFEPTEQGWLHEKGTLYVNAGSGFDGVSVPGKLGDVAFPRVKGKWRKIQRVHFYLTDRRFVFAGKTIKVEFLRDQLKSHAVKPGGLVFEFDGGEDDGKERKRLAFTFSNPLIVGAVVGGAGDCNVDIGCCKGGEYGRCLRRGH